MDGTQPNQIQRERTTLWWVMRAVWTLLAGVHVWPLAAVGCRVFAAPSLDEGLVFASLIGVFTLFACKAADASWLRFHRPGLEFVAFVLAAALVHGDVASSNRLPALAAETATTVVAGAGVAVASSRRLRRRIGEYLRGLSLSARRIAGARRPVGLVELVGWRCPATRVRRRMPARGPPRLVH